MFSSTIEVTPAKFYPLVGTILLPVPTSFLSLPAHELLLSGRMFERKPELHVTVVGRKTGELLKDAYSEDETIKRSIKELVSQTRWNIKPTRAYLQIKKLKCLDGQPITARSIITLVDIPGSEHFFEKLSELVRVNLPRPPFHITLLTHGDPEGIELSSVEDLTKYKEMELQRPW